MDKIDVVVVQAINSRGYNVNLSDIKKSLFYHIGMNSIDLIELIVQLEELFDIEFDINDMVISDDFSMEKIVQIVEKNILKN